MVRRFEVQSTLRLYRQHRSQTMTTRRAACSCGQLHLTVDGEPSRVSMCNCLECQRRTGGVIGNLMGGSLRLVRRRRTVLPVRRTANLSNLEESSHESKRPNDPACSFSDPG